MSQVQGLDRRYSDGLCPNELTDTSWFFGLRISAERQTWASV